MRMFCDGPGGARTKQRLEGLGLVLVWRTSNSKSKRDGQSEVRVPADTLWGSVDPALGRSSSFALRAGDLPALSDETKLGLARVHTTQGVFAFALFWVFTLV
jgi:hypothetical protein